MAADSVVRYDVGGTIPQWGGVPPFRMRCARVGVVREREFWELVDEVFGRAYGRSLACDQRMDRLGGRNAVEALEAGEEPRVVWNVLCDQMGVSDGERWGADHMAPPMPTGGPRLRR